MFLLSLLSVKSEDGPKDAYYVKMPAITPLWKHFARAYYAMEKLGIASSLHRKIFDHIHKEHKRLKTVAQIQDYIASQSGLEVGKIRMAMNSSYVSNSQTISGLFAAKHNWHSSRLFRVISPHGAYTLLHPGFVCLSLIQRGNTMNTQPNLKNEITAAHGSLEAVASGDNTQIDLSNDPVLHDLLNSLESAGYWKQKAGYQPVMAIYSRNPRQCQYHKVLLPGITLDQIEQ